MYRIVNDII